MVKEKRILSYFIGWLILGFIVIFMGVNNVFAASYNVNSFTAQLYDNLGPNLNSVNTSKEEDGSLYYYGFIGLTANSSGGAWGISSPIPLIANHTYSMTVDPYVPGCGYTILSSYPRLGVGSSLANAVTSYQNNTNVNEKFYQAVSNSNYLQYVFTPTINSSYIVFPYATTKSCNSTTNQLSTIIIEDLGESGVSQQQINTSLNNQTNELNNSIQNSTDTITGEIDDMEQNIIDSNKETQDVIKDQFNECKQSINLLNIPNSTRESNGINTTINNNRININGTLSNTYASLTYDFNFNIRAGTYVFSVNKKVPFSIDMYIDGIRATTLSANTLYSTFNVNKDTKITGFAMHGKNGQTYNISDLVFQVESGTTPTKVIPYGEEDCTNRIDDTNDKLDGIQGAITDSSSPDTSSLQNSAGWLPAGPLDSILNLPLTMLNSLTNSLGKTCNPLNLTLPYVNKSIQIPCLSSIFAKITGVNGLWTWVGTIASVLILYNYLLNLYAWVDRVLTLRAEFDEAMGADLANWGRL